MSRSSQALEGLQGEAEHLRSQLSKTMSVLQEQRGSLMQARAAAVAREEELLGRCRNLEARLQAGAAQYDAAAAELSMSRSDAAEVFPPYSAWFAQIGPCSCCNPVGYVWCTCSVTPLRLPGSHACATPGRPSTFGH